MGGGKEVYKEIDELNRYVGGGGKAHTRAMTSWPQQ
jgi:hypothetical protein